MITKHPARLHLITVWWLLTATSVSLNIAFIFLAMIVHNAPAVFWLLLPTLITLIVTMCWFLVAFNTSSISAGLPSDFLLPFFSCAFLWHSCGGHNLVTLWSSLLLLSISFHSVHCICTAYVGTECVVSLL